MSDPHRVVIVGGGFGGLHAALRLKRAPVSVTLIDRRNFHLFQPLLYQVATGGLSPANIAAPLRAVLKRQRNARVLLGEVTGVDARARSVRADGTEIPYDTLVAAAGARHHYFGNDHWEEHAPGLKTVEDATAIRRRILVAFEEAEREPDPARRGALLTFAVAGGGPTGVEMAGALAELAHHTLRREFRAIDPAGARILLLEGGDRVLPGYPEDLSLKASAALKRMGVTLRTGVFVTDVGPDSVTVKAGEDHERIDCRTVIWAAGVRAAPLGAILAAAAGAGTDRAGRIRVEPDLTLPGRPEIFVIGDLALFPHQTGGPLPGIAPVAIQQGRYVAALIRRRLLGGTLPPFRYRDYGTMATIGRAAAVADFGRFRLSGYPAWLAWLFVHLMKLVQFENRLLVFVQWLWNYLTRNRAARLITWRPPPP